MSLKVLDLVSINCGMRKVIFMLFIRRNWWLTPTGTYRKKSTQGSARHWTSVFTAAINNYCLLFVARLSRYTSAYSLVVMRYYSNSSQSAPSLEEDYSGMIDASERGL